MTLSADGFRSFRSKMKGRVGKGIADRQIHCIRRGLIVAAGEPANEFLEAFFLGIRQGGKLKARLAQRYSGKRRAGRDIYIRNPFDRHALQPHPLAGEHNLKFDRSMQIRLGGFISDISKSQPVQADIPNLPDTAGFRR